MRFAEVLGAMGASVDWAPHTITITGPPPGGLRGVDAGCVDIPDAAMTLAVAALFAHGATTIRDVGSWRVKETERMKAICAELGKLGASVEEGETSCVITPPVGGVRAAEIETYDDHRMAMAFSLAACGGGFWGDWRFFYFIVGGGKEGLGCVKRRGREAAERDP